MDDITTLQYYVPDAPLQVAAAAAAESAQHGQGEVSQPAGESTLQGAGHPGTGIVIIITRAATIIRFSQSQRRPKLGPSPAVLHAPAVLRRSLLLRCRQITC